jgi:sugar lactone lactonase YvrE
LLAAACLPAQSGAAQPWIPEVVIEGRFNGAEGLAFNGEGRLFMAANRAIWEVLPDGGTRQVAGSASNLGLAALGVRDILHADFGPLTWPRDGENDDGVVWRITPEGGKTAIARGIGDPNAIVVLPDGRLLVSDDFTNNVYSVAAGGEVRVFTDAIPFPNGLALAPDGSALYVAQIFGSAPEGPPPVRFTDFSDRVWRLPLAGGEPAGPPEILFATGGPSGPDGLALGPDGLLYLTAARAGELWRIDPATRQGELLADGLPGLASLAFGLGKFDADSLYVVQIRGGRLLRFPIAKPHAGGEAGGVPSCESQPVYSRLDFWVGDWEVFVGAQKVGDDRVAKTLNGCAITESWTASNGGQGFSLFYVDPAESRWKQAWVTGRALAPGGVKEKRLIETLPGGGVRFEGAVRDTTGQEWLDRTTLVPQPDGSVGQRIEVSKDDGATWEPTFDAVYRRHPDG